MYDDKVQSLCRSPSSVHYEISLALAHQTKGKCCATITHRNIFTHVCAYTHMHTYIAISCTVQQKGFSLFWDIYCTYVVEKSIHIRHVPIVVEHFTVRVWTKVGRTFQNGVILPGKKCLANGSFAQIQHSAFCLECSWHKNKCGWLIFKVNTLTYQLIHAQKSLQALPLGLSGDRQHVNVFPTDKTLHPTVHSIQTHSMHHCCTYYTRRYVKPQTIHTT
jgi:hypothetical protein